MNPVSQVFEYRYPSRADWPLLSLRIPVVEIAERFGLSVEKWEEDGLGQATGLFIRLPSGRIVLLRELQHAREYHGEEGPTVHVGAGELGSLGVEPLVAEILEGLDMTSDLVKWVVSSDARQQAADLAASARSYFDSLNRPGSA